MSKQIQKAPPLAQIIGDADAPVSSADNTYQFDLAATEKKAELFSAKDCEGQVIVDPLDDFPDGGMRAWLVVAGAFFNTFSTFGFVNAWGVYQSYYEEVLLKDVSASDIAWIGSIQYSLTFVPGLITGRLFDLGYLRIPLLISSALIVLATFLIAECQTYWQFVLCQGIAIGIGSGFIFGPSVGVISHWFRRRRATALGIMAGGSSIGGTLFPIIFQNLVRQIGFPWTMRILGFILIFSLGIANLTMARRLPPVNVSGGLLNLKEFRSIPYCMFTLAGFFSFLGLYTVLTYINVSAIAEGIPVDFATYLISIANASSLIGRIASGIIADEIGSINIMAPFTAVAGILTYAWPYVHGERGYVALAVFYGISSGAYVSLISAPVIALGGTGDVGRRVGMYLTILAVGALAGPPISGAINTATNGFAASGIYAGTAVVISVIIMWYARCLVLHRFWGKF